MLAAQLSTGHSTPDALGKERVLRVLQQALDVAPLDILVIGWEEIPELYHTLTARETRRTNETYLWYPLLSDYPGLKVDHLVLNYKGVASRGWGGFTEGGEMSETFRFVCPNNPEARETTFSHLERLLTTYDFDGVFLDKFRFPSPANGLEEMLSCFCTHCQRAASEQGLDLTRVRKVLENPIPSNSSTPHPTPLPGAQWLTDLLANHPILQRFIRFRSASITKLVAAVHTLTQRLGKKLALDVFSPGLAPLVGQDYPSIAQYGVWTKPMIYRFAKGPAGLRLELPSLGVALERFLEYDSNQALSWAQRRVPGLIDTTFARIDSEGVPLGLIADETRQAVELMAPTPIYLGLETVSMPGVIHITPKHIEEIVEVGRAAGITGVVLSWDLIHTPIENLRPLGAIV